MGNITLEMTVEEVNTILRTLGKHPFEEVVTLIQKIKEQGEPQVAAMAEAATTAEEAPAAE
jgi:hypothetical protein